LKNFLIFFLKFISFIVLEQLDTLKKAQSLVTAPVIYSKFLFTELIKALQNLTMNSNMLETLVLEGLPLSGRYMTTFASGLTQNQTIKSLSFMRCNIGDAACDILCETLKHLTNVETLNLSGCNLGVKGIEAVTNLVKFHKIQRFSEAWSQSLRYRNVDADSFPGLRKILLNNNPDIGDKGVEVLAEALKEDVWVKDIEMQRCGLTDEGAQHIINCLNINRTILCFNISGNPEVSEHLYRHIIVHLGHADLDSSDSNESSPEKLSKFQLLDKVKFLEDQLEMEIFRRKKMEELHDKLQQQVVEFQKEITFQGSFRIPDGFTLVANSTMEKLLKE
jgi:centrosomal protein CEP78